MDYFSDERLYFVYNRIRTFREGVNGTFGVVILSFPISNMLFPLLLPRGIFFILLFFGLGIVNFDVSEHSFLLRVVGEGGLFLAET